MTQAAQTPEASSRRPRSERPAATPERPAAAAWRQWLGYAGLVPFWGLAVALWLEASLGSTVGFAGFEALLTQALLVYAAVIVSFMAAIHWGIALLRPDWAPLGLPGPLFAVVPALLAWVAVVGLPAPAAAVSSALLLVVLWVVERRAACAEVWGAAYARLRSHLTFWASAALVFAAIALAAGGAA